MVLKSYIDRQPCIAFLIYMYTIYNIYNIHTNLRANMVEYN